MNAPFTPDDVVRALGGHATPITVDLKRCQATADANGKSELVRTAEEA
jgi:hypothetical protein